MIGYEDILDYQQRLEAEEIREEMIELAKESQEKEISIDEVIARRKANN